MVGILRVNSRYRFVTNKQQLLKLANDMNRKRDDVAHSIIFIDALMTVDGRTSVSHLVVYLAQQARKLDISLVFVGEQDTRLDRRIEYMRTDKLSLLRTPIQYQEEKQ